MDDQYAVKSLRWRLRPLRYPTLFVSALLSVVASVWFAVLSDPHGTLAWTLIIISGVTGVCLAYFAIDGLRSGDEDRRQILALKTEAAKRDARLAAHEEASETHDREIAEGAYQHWIDGDVGQSMLLAASWGHGPYPSFEWYQTKVGPHSAE